MANAAVDVIHQNGEQFAIEQLDSERVVLERFTQRALTRSSL